MVQTHVDEQPKGVSWNRPPAHMNGDEVRYSFLYSYKSYCHTILRWLYENSI